MNLVIALSFKAALAISNPTHRKIKLTNNNKKETKQVSDNIFANVLK